MARILRIVLIAISVLTVLAVMDTFDVFPLEARGHEGTLYSMLAIAIIVIFLAWYKARRRGEL